MGPFIRVGDSCRLPGLMAIGTTGMSPARPSRPDLPLFHTAGNPAAAVYDCAEALCRIRDIDGQCARAQYFVSTLTAFPAVAMACG